MTIKRGTEEATPALSSPIIEWVRSQEYRSLYSNLFKYRIGKSDVTVTFSSVVESVGMSPVTQVQEDASVIMTWPQLKMFSQHLNVLVQAIEQELGKINIPADQPTKEEMLEAGINRVRALNYPKKA